MKLGELVDLLLAYKEYEDAVTRAEQRVFWAKIRPYEEGAAEWLRETEANLAEARARLAVVRAREL